MQNGLSGLLGTLEGFIQLQPHYGASSTPGSSVFSCAWQYCVFFPWRWGPGHNFTQKMGCVIFTISLQHLGLKGALLLNCCCLLAVLLKQLSPAHQWMNERSLKMVYVHSDSTSETRKKENMQLLCSEMKKLLQTEWQSKKAEIKVVWDWCQNWYLVVNEWWQILCACRRHWDERFGNTCFFYFA